MTRPKPSALSEKVSLMPKKPIRVNRDHQINVRLSADEYDQIQAACEKAGKDQSEYIRERVLAPTLIKEIRSAVRSEVRALKK